MAAAIRAAYARQNVGTACPWDGLAARRLADALAAIKGWPLDDLLCCVANRFASDRNHAEAPAAWLPSLAGYRAGPLDRYGRPLRTATAAAAPASVSIGAHPADEPQAAPPPPSPRIAPGGDAKALALWLDGLDHARRGVPESQHRRLLRVSRGDSIDADGRLTVCALEGVPAAVQEAALAALARKGVRAISVIAGVPAEGA